MTAHAKDCVVCGRVIEWRKKWARCWDEVKYCSNACRKSPLKELDEALEAHIVTLLKSQPQGTTICPSLAARKIAPDTWRMLMERTRMAARRLVNQGVIDIKQNGQTVDPNRAKGPIRLALRNCSRR